MLKLQNGDSDQCNTLQESLELIADFACYSQLNELVNVTVGLMKEESKYHLLVHRMIFFSYFESIKSLHYSDEGSFTNMLDIYDSIMIRNCTANSLDDWVFTRWSIIKQMCLQVLYRHLNITEMPNEKKFKVPKDFKSKAFEKEYSEIFKKPSVKAIPTVKSNLSQHISHYVEAIKNQFNSVSDSYGNVSVKNLILLLRENKLDDFKNSAHKHMMKAQDAALPLPKLSIFSSIPEHDLFKASHDGEVLGTLQDWNDNQEAEQGPYANTRTTKNSSSSSSSSVTQQQQQQQQSKQSKKGSKPASTDSSNITTPTKATSSNAAEAAIASSGDIQINNLSVAAHLLRSKDPLQNTVNETAQYAKATSANSHQDASTRNIDSPECVKTSSSSSSSKKSNSPKKGLTETRASATQITFSSSSNKRLSSSRNTNDDDNDDIDDADSSPDAFKISRLANRQNQERKEFPSTLSSAHDNSDSDNENDSKRRRSSNGEYQRKRWSFEEEELFRQAYKRHGHGNWKDMRDDPKYSMLAKNGRTNVNLKDKYRSMLAKNPNVFG